MGAGSFANIKAWTDGSDIIGVRGTAKRTEKGELSVKVAHWEMLTKSLTALPDKFTDSQTLRSATEPDMSTLSLIRMSARPSAEERALPPLSDGF